MMHSELGLLHRGNSIPETIPKINTKIKKEGFIFDIKVSQGKEVKAR